VNQILVKPPTTQSGYEITQKNLEIVNKIMALSAKLVKISIDSISLDSQRIAKNYLHTLEWCLRSMKLDKPNELMEKYLNDINVYCNELFEDWKTAEITYLETLREI